MFPVPIYVAARPWSLLLPMLMLGATAHAQDKPGVSDPADPSLVTASEYRSIFQDYKNFQPVPAPSWRAVNDRVLSVGGHAGALRDAPPVNPAQAPSAVPLPSPQPPVQTSPAGGHGAHGGHGGAK